MKRRLADFVLWLTWPLVDWCLGNCTWIPLEPEDE